MTKVVFWPIFWAVCVAAGFVFGNLSSVWVNAKVAAVKAKYLAFKAKVKAFFHGSK